MDARSFVVFTWTTISLVAAIAVLVATENLVFGIAIGVFDLILGIVLFQIVGRLGIRPPSEEEED